MATFNRQLAIAFGAQGAEGTADATIAALTGSLDLADGIVLGDAASGVAESGITHSFERRLREKGPVSGGFTLQSSDFLEEVISLQFAFPLAGNRITTPGTPADADFTHQKGIDDLFGACGLTGAASVTNPTVGWAYTPADVAIATAKLFDSGLAWVIRDIRGSWSLDMTPGQIAIMTCTLQGVVDSFAAVAFPTLDYEEQASVSAPSVSGVVPSWGISDEERGWSALTIGCDNALSRLPDAASSTGESIEQSGRTITVEMTMRETDTDLDHARANLAATSAPTDDLKATVGTIPNAGSEAATAYRLEASNLEVRSLAPVTIGESKKAGAQVSAVCTGTTDGSEFTLAFG